MLHDVRLSRTGDMVYGPGQSPITPGADGRSIVSRDESVVFAADAISSFIGKPVTIGHPAEAVTPANWKDQAQGHILSARRGSPPYASFLVGDVLVTAPEAIQLAEDGCEISCGYDAAYEQTGPGRGRQTRVVGNHLAFLPDGKHGRCGPMCYVGDQSMEVEDPPMTVKTSPGVALLQRLFGARDESEVRTVLDAAAADEDKARDAELTRLREANAKLTKDAEEAAAKKKQDDEDDEDDDGKGKKDKPTMDSLTALRSRVVAAAEILSPGFTVPTIDAAGDLVATFDTLCGCQKKALDAAYATPQGKVVLETLSPGFDTGKMTVDQIGASFFAAAGMLGASRNASVAAMLAASGGFGQSEVQSNMERSKAASARSAERWAKVRAERTAIHH